MLYRFEIALADVDRGVYQDLDLRAGLHPSEDIAFLLTRVLAFALEYTEGLAFSSGLSDGQEPALWLKSPEGRVLHWLEVGTPAPDRLHRASKLAERVTIYCHRRPDLFRQRCAKERIHKSDSIRLVEVPPSLISELSRQLDRNNKWDLSVHEARTTIVCGGAVIEATLVTRSLAQDS